MTHMFLATCVQILVSFQRIYDVLKIVEAKAGLNYGNECQSCNIIIVTYMVLLFKIPTVKFFGDLFSWLWEKNIYKKVNFTFSMNFLNYLVIVGVGKGWNWGPIIKSRATSLNPSNLISMSSTFGFDVDEILWYLFPIALNPPLVPFLHVLGPWQRSQICGVYL